MGERRWKDQIEESSKRVGIVNFMQGRRLWVATPAMIVMVLADGMLQEARGPYEPKTLLMTT